MSEIVRLIKYDELNKKGYAQKHWIKLYKLQKNIIAIRLYY